MKSQRRCRAYHALGQNGKKVSSRWHHIGKSSLLKEPVGREQVEVRVEVRVEVGVVTERVDEHDNARRAIGKAYVCITLNNSINMTKAV